LTEAEIQQHPLDGPPLNPARPRIGVLAIQGNYASHAQALTKAGAEPVEVRKPGELAAIDALVLPGGESTTMLRFLEKHRFFEELRQFCAVKPVFGTCAGAILLAREVLTPPQRSLGLLDATVERNAYGRQIDSAIVSAETALPGGPLEMVFIRAPRIVSVGPGVEVLARRDGYPTLVRQGQILAATFHPELSQDRRVHKLFVASSIVARAVGAAVISPALQRWVGETDNFPESRRDGAHALPLTSLPED
jgi:5'-phosphate synthase pdxT subunit